MSGDKSKDNNRHPASNTSSNRSTTDSESRLETQDNSQLESDSLATTRAGALEGYFPSSSGAFPSATPRPVSTSRSGDSASQEGSHPRDVQTKGGLQHLRESLSRHRASTNTQDSVAAPDHVRDFGRKTPAVTPPRRPTEDSAQLRQPASSEDIQQKISPSHKGRHVRKAGSNNAQQANTTGTSATSVPRASIASKGKGREILLNENRDALAISTSKDGTAISPYAPRRSVAPHLSINPSSSPARSPTSPQKRPQPFSLAGAPVQRAQSSFHNRARRSSGGSVPPGVAVPTPRAKKPPSWASKSKNKPLFSLGKPLPTHEEVQAQKAWEEQADKLKEKYPDADPPAPPALPSQQEGVAASGGGLQLDREQLQDVIRTVIAEFQSYQNGTLDINPAPGSFCAEQKGSERRPTGVSSRLYRTAGSQRAGSEQQEDGGSELATLDSVVVEDEDDDPLPEGLTPHGQGRPPRFSENWAKTRRRKVLPSDTVLHGSQKQPAAPDDQRTEVARQEHDEVERRDRQDEEKPDKPQPALPSKPQRRKSSDGTAAAAEGDVHDLDDDIGKTAVNSVDSGVEDRNDVQEENEESSTYGGEGRDQETEPREEEEEDGEDFPNPIAKLRSYIREPAAEFLGAMVLAIIGIGATIQTNIATNPTISPSGQGSASLAVNLGQPLAWGIGVAVSVYVAGGISGGHISPVISIVLAVFRGFPWSKVPGYILAQILGFTAGSSITYGLYRHGISIVEGNGATRTLGTSGTAGYFATYPRDYVSNANAFMNEFVDVALLLILILAIGDSTNVPPPAGLNPIILMFTVTAIGLALGSQSAYALNPARDLGPRLVSWWAGYGTAVFDNRDQYWLWCVWPADILGGLVGALLYDTLIFTGEESPLNYRWKWGDLHPSRIADKYKKWKKHNKTKNETRVESWTARRRDWGDKRRGTKEKKEEEV